jgi:hypothetical protein
MRIILRLFIVLILFGTIQSLLMAQKVLNGDGTPAARAPNPKELAQQGHEVSPIVKTEKWVQ